MPDPKGSSRKTADICVGGRKEWRSSHRKDVIAEMWPSCLGGLDSARRSPLLPRAFGTNHPGWRTEGDGGSYKPGGHCDEAGGFTHRIFHFRSHIIKVFWQLETVARLQRWVYMLEIGKNFKKKGLWRIWLHIRGGRGIWVIMNLILFGAIIYRSLQPSDGNVSLLGFHNKW